MTRLVQLLMLASLAVLCGCDLLAGLLPGNGDRWARDVIEIAEGDDAALADGAVVISFVTKLEESRCPHGAECVHAGQARIQMQLHRRGEPPSDFELRIGGFVDRDTERGHMPVRVDGLTFTLLELSPYPDLQTDPQPSHSVATIRVTEGRMTEE